MNGFENVKKNFGFGCMRLPMKDGKVDYAVFSEMVDLFMAGGFNYFDTARVYLGGQSETAIRDCVVKRYSRESFVLADKLSSPLFSREEDIVPLFEKQRVPLHTRQFEESVRKAFFKSLFNNVLIDEVLPESRIQTSPERKQRSIFELFSVVPFNLLQGFQFRFPYGTGEPVH